MVEPEEGPTLAEVGVGGGRQPDAGDEVGPGVLTDQIAGELHRVEGRSAGRARRLALALHNAETYAHEQRVAGTFQRAALPQTLPERSDVFFDAVYEAGRSEALVGGDWYDAVQLLGGRILVSIGDVCGSGLSAAVTMGLMRQSIRAVGQTTPDPVAILDAADRTLRATRTGS